MRFSGYIIEKYNKMGNAYTCRRLVEEAAVRGIHLTIIGIHDTRLTDQGIFNKGRRLEPRDFLINRYKTGKIPEALNGITGRSYNEFRAFSTYVNKYNQLRDLSSPAFLKPACILGTGLTPYQEIVNMIGLPFVAKGLESSMGQEILLISNEGDYRNLQSENLQEKEWLFEECITGSLGRDIRLYSIRGQVLACMERQSDHDFRANVALGARVRPLEVTENFRQAAKDIYRQTGLDFLGIDLLYGKNKPWFCEINVMPGIEGMERATGVNIAGNIIETIRNDLENSLNDK